MYVCALVGTGSEKHKYTACSCTQGLPVCMTLSLCCFVVHSCNLKLLNVQIMCSYIGISSIYLGKVCRDPDTMERVFPLTSQRFSGIFATNFNINFPIMCENAIRFENVWNWNYCKIPENLHRATSALLNMLNGYKMSSTYHAAVYVCIQVDWLAY